MTQDKIAEPMETTLSDTTPDTETDQLATLVGGVAAREFDAAKDTYKPSLLGWAQALPTLDDLAFQDEAESAIHASALVNSFGGNWEHEHFKASACYHESERRKLATHASSCEVSTLYDRAYNRVVRSQGHASMARDPHPCTCTPAAATATTCAD